MRIALFTDGIYPYVIGGMQKHSFYLAKYFALNKIQVDLYHTASDISSIQNLNCFTDEENKFITSFPIKYPIKNKLPGHYIREMHSYSKLIFDEFSKQGKVDFVYIQGLCGMYSFDHKLEIDIPIGVNFHGLEMFQKAANFRTKLEQYLFKSRVSHSLKNADVVFSLGGKLTKIIKKQGIPDFKISQVSIGIDDSWIRTTGFIKNEIKKFIFIGRYERRKGIEELNFVIKELAQNNDFSIDFIGNIPEDKKIKSNKVNYFGSISDIQKIKKILLDADVLICPSYSEGMPTVIMEAMASGLAIIASDVGAISEQVNIKNGILVSPGDKNELKNAMIEMIQKHQFDLDKMKKESIEIVRKTFLWDLIIKKTIDEISYIVSKNREKRV